MSDIPDEHKEALKKLIRACELDMLSLLEGFFNGEKRTLLCIEVEHEDEFEMFPLAVMISHDKDELWDFDRQLLSEGFLPEVVNNENR